MFNKIIRAVLLILLGCLIGTICTTYKDKRLYDNYAFLGEANAFKLECLECADAYIENSQILMEKLDQDTSICFADTYGELDCVYEMDKAYEKLDSLANTQL